MLFVKKNLRKLVFSIRKECNCTTNDEVITQASATKAILITQHVTPSLTCSISLMKSDILYSTKTPRSHFDIFFAKPVFIKSYPLYQPKTSKSTDPFCRRTILPASSTVRLYHGICGFFKSNQQHVAGVHI
jgi:hypothetical protein